jgi:hypothetical protein
MSKEFMTKVKESKENLTTELKWLFEKLSNLQTEIAEKKEQIERYQKSEEKIFPDSILVEGDNDNKVIEVNFQRGGWMNR